jgi:hypothetical protein
VALELAAALAGLPIADASVTAAGLAGAGLFAGSPDLRFRHPILGSSVRATMAGHERA